jgi:hypothetical protein
VATQTQSKGGLANNLLLQMALLLVGVIVVIALAAKYIW